MMMSVMVANLRMMLVLTVVLMWLAAFALPVTASASSYGKDTVIVPEDGIIRQTFGASLVADENWLAVGAPLDDDKATRSGSIYMYQASGSGSTRSWKYYSKITPEDGRSLRYFGEVIAMSGQYLGVGAWRDFEKGDESGSVYLYYRTVQGPWNQIIKLLAADGAAGDAYGQALAVDGHALAVGAPGDDDNGVNSGSVYMYTLSGPTPTLKTKIAPSDGYLDDGFGSALTISGTLCAIGSPNDDDLGDMSGSVYLYRQDTSSGVWNLLQKIRGHNGQQEDLFGAAVDLSGQTLVVGAYGSSRTYAGAAEIFSWNETLGNFTFVAEIVPAAPQAGSHFGREVEIYQNEILVAAPYWESADAVTTTGRAYLFGFIKGAWTQMETYELEQPISGAEFGHAVSIMKDMTLIAAPGVFGQAVSSGAVYVKHSAYCQDGLVHSVEDCDDGNNVTGDGCSASCQLEHGWGCHGDSSTCFVCGNSVVELAMTCDDGNFVNGDGCDQFCQVETGYGCYGEPSGCVTCGNGVLGTNQECDDGNVVSGDGCSSICTIEAGWNCSNAPSQCQSCGNGKKEYTEVCDDGNSVNGDGCSNCAIDAGSSCRNNSELLSICKTCGNSVKEDDESCDDGNSIAGDGCDSSCQVETGYYCDNQLPSVCQKCGNGRVEGTEICDDNNIISGDGCSPQCTVEKRFICTPSSNPLTPAYNISTCSHCGNGFLEVGEVCDDGNYLNHDGCDEHCVVESLYSCSSVPDSKSSCSLCGNGNTEAGEGCDDGNLKDGDGCSPSCTVEAGWNCVARGKSHCAKIEVHIKPEQPVKLTMLESFIWWVVGIGG